VGDRLPYRDISRLGIFQVERRTIPGVGRSPPYLSSNRLQDSFKQAYMASKAEV